MKLAIIFIEVLLFITFSSGESINDGDQPLRGIWDFSPLKAWEADIAGKDFLVNIRRIRVDNEGNCYLLDIRSNKIHVFNAKGEHKLSFARRGEGPGEIKLAFDFFIVKDTIIVPDGTKIHYFSKTGTYKKSIKIQEELVCYLFIDEHHPLAIPLSLMALRDKSKPRPVYLYDLKDSQKKTVIELAYLRCFRYYGGGNRIILEMPAIVQEELFVARSAQGFIYGYSDKYIIYKMDQMGTITGSLALAGRARHVISKTEKEILVKKAIQQIGNFPKSVVKEMVKQFPEELPHFHHLHVDQNDIIYVLTSKIKSGNEKTVDLFSPEGEYIYRGHLKIDEQYHILKLAIRWNRLLVFVEDDEGERKLVSYTIHTPTHANSN